MRKLLILLCLMAWPSFAAISYVSGSHTVCLQATAVSTATCTLGGTTTNGNVVVVGMSWKTVTRTVKKVVGSSGAQFHLVGFRCSASECASLSVCVNCAAQTTVAPTFSSTTIFAVGVEEYSGVTALGITGTATATSTNPGLSLTTGDSNNFIVGVTAALGNAGIPTCGTGCVGNLRDANMTGSTSSHVSIGMMDNTVASPGSVSIADTISSGVWAATAIELRTSAPSKSYLWPDCDGTHPCVIFRTATISSGPSNGAGTGESNYKFTVPPTKAGNSIVLFMTHLSSKTITLSDDKTNTWHQASTTTDATNGVMTEVNYVCNPTTGTSVITLGTSSAYVTFDLFQVSYVEVSGVDSSGATSCIDGTATAANTLTPNGLIQPGSITTATDGALVFAYASSTLYNGAVLREGQAFPDDVGTMIYQNPYDHFAWSVQLQATHGAINPGIYQSTNQLAHVWNMAGVALKASNGSGTQPSSSGNAYVTGILHYLDDYDATGVWVPWHSNGNATVIQSSGGSTASPFTNLKLNNDVAMTRTAFTDAGADPQTYYYCYGSGAGGRDQSFQYSTTTPHAYIIADVSGAKKSTGSGCVGTGTNNHVTGTQAASANANIVGDDVFTAQAASSAMIGTSYFGSGPAERMCVSSSDGNNTNPPTTACTGQTVGFVMFSMWASGMSDASRWDNGDPYWLFYTTGTSSTSVDMVMANSQDAAAGGTGWAGAAIEILAEPAAAAGVRRRISIIQ